MPILTTVNTATKCSVWDRTSATEGAQTTAEDVIEASSKKLHCVKQISFPHSVLDANSQLSKFFCQSCVLINVCHFSIKAKYNVVKPQNLNGISTEKRGCYDCCNTW